MFILHNYGVLVTNGSTKVHSMDLESGLEKEKYVDESKSNGKDI